jgi:8-oxo-dGTP pyrophosphatase MutT (NUDIX family)
MPRDRPGPDVPPPPDGGGVPDARRSASVLLLRGGEETLEVLLVQRTQAARFMAGFWVFPGGKVDDTDAGERAAAVRELAEEADVHGVDPATLRPFARWVTPERSRMRFDAFFFVAAAPPDPEPHVDGVECIDWAWFAPAAALAAYDEGALQLALPTWTMLTDLGAYATAQDALAAELGEPVAILPRLVGDRIVLPGEPDY